MSWSRLPTTFWRSLTHSLEITHKISVNVCRSSSIDAKSYNIFIRGNFFYAFKTHQLKMASPVSMALKPWDMIARDVIKIVAVIVMEGKSNRNSNAIRNVF